MKKAMIINFCLLFVFSLGVNIVYWTDEDPDEYLTAEFIENNESYVTPVMPAKVKLEKYLTDEIKLGAKDASLAIEILNQLQLEKKKSQEKLIDLMGQEKAEKFLHHLEQTQKETSP